MAVAKRIQGQHGHTEPDLAAGKGLHVQMDCESPLLYESMETQAKPNTQFFKQRTYRFFEVIAR